MLTRNMPACLHACTDVASPTSANGKKLNPVHVEGSGTLADGEANAASSLKEVQCVCACMLVYVLESFPRSLKYPNATPGQVKWIHSLVQVRACDLVVRPDQQPDPIPSLNHGPNLNHCITA